MKSSRRVSLISLLATASILLAVPLVFFLPLTENSFRISELIWGAPQRASHRETFTDGLQLSSNTRAIEMEQIDRYDSTTLFSGGPFQGLLSARDVLNSPIDTSTTWLDQIPDRQDLPIAHRYAAIVQNRTTKSRALSISEYPTKVRCQYRPSAYIAIIVSAPFRDGTSQLPRGYRYAIVDTRRKDMESTFIAHDLEKSTDGDRFNIAAIVFPASLKTPADAPLVLELLR